MASLELKDLKEDDHPEILVVAPETPDEPGETTVADVESQSNAVDVPEIPEGETNLRMYN